MKQSLLTKATKSIRKNIAGAYCPVSIAPHPRITKWLIAAVLSLLLANPLATMAQCTTGCNQTRTTNATPATNNFSNTFCITTASSLTYNQNFDINGGTLCVGPNVTFSASGGNYNGNWTINNYGSFSRNLSLNSGQTFYNYGTFTGSLTINGGTVVNYGTLTPSSFTFNGGAFTNNSGGTATFSSSVTVNSGATFTNNGNMSMSGLTLNSSAIATLGGTTTISGNVTNNGTVNIGGVITISGNYNQNSSGTLASQPGGQCNAINVTGTIQGQGTYNGSNGLLLNKNLSPTCTGCLVNGASTTPPGQPSAQISSPVLSSTATTINGSISNPGGSPAATHYLILRRFGSQVTDVPVDYTNYTVGSTIGSSTVVAANAISTLTFADAAGIATYGCGTYHYAVFAYNASGSCGAYNKTIGSSNRSSITISSTSGSISGAAAVCEGNAAPTLTLTGYTGSIVRWEYSVSPFSSWTSISNTAATYSPGVLTQTTQYRAVVNAGTSCSNSTSSAVTVTVNTRPAISASTGATRCGNGTVTLTATPSSGATIDWYSLASGGTALLSGNATYSPSVTATTTYYAEARNTSSGCVAAARTAVIANVNASPSITLANFTPVCSGTTSVNLSYSSPVNSPNEYAIDWSNAANAAGFADVSWTALSGGIINITGISSTAGSYAASILVRNSSTGCQTDVSNGTVVSCGTASENGSLTLTAPASGVFTTINFASYGTPTGSCGSYTTSSCNSATSVSVVQAAALGNNSFTLTANNSTFGDPCVGTLKSLYIEAVSTAQILNIYSIPTITATTAASVCGTGSASIAATPSAGAVVDWYASSSGGTALATASNSFTTPSLSATTTYYAEARNSTAGCLSSSRYAVTVTVNSVPAAPAVSAGSRCGTGTVTLTATPASGETIDWYDAASGGNLLLAGNTTFTSPSISSTTTYYAAARSSSTGCSSATRTAVTATVNAVPSITLSAFTALCSGTTNTTLTYSSPVNSPNEYSINWSTAANTAGIADVAWTTLSGGIINISGLTTTAGTYAANIYVRNSSTGCQADVSNGSAITCGTVTENATLTLTAPGSGVFTAINFASYGTPTGSCGSYATSSCHSSTSLSVIQTRALGNNSFTVTANNGTFGDPCYGTTKRLYVEAVSTVQLLTINALPNITGTTPATRCGTGTVTIAATVSSGGSIDWYADATGGTALQSGSNSFTTPSLLATTVYYAQATNTTTGCNAATRTAVTASVTVPSITSFTPTAGGPGTSVVITGANFTGATAVSFGGTAAASYTVNSATQITAIVATGSTGNVAVTTACGTATGNTYTFYPAPVITSFTPTSGYITNTITITGSNFTGATAVSFGGTAAASYTVVSATTITAVLGTGATGVVSVTTAGGTATRSGFTYIPATIWAGTFNNSWNNAGNWNNGVPLATSLVVIPPVETYPALSSTTTISSMLMDAGTSLTINGTNTLTITGSLTQNGSIAGTGTVIMGGSSAQNISGTGTVNNITINNSTGVSISSGSNMLNITGTLTPTSGAITTNGNLTLKSSAAGTARVDQGPAAGNYLIGTIIFERFIPASRSWRLISFPFVASGAPTINASFQEGAGGTTNNPNPGYGTHITGGTIANGFDQNTAGNPSLKELSGNSWVGISNTNQPITNKQGYFVFVRGSRANQLNLGASAPADNTTLRGTAVLKQGTQAISISGSGWQLTGNPFPSPINLGAIATSNSSLLKNNFKFWDPKLGGSNNVGGFVTASYNGSSYDYAPAPVSSISEFAQSGAAFFVDAKSAGTLTIAESNKAKGGSDNVFRPYRTNAKIHINLKSYNSNGTVPVVDGVMLGYDDNYSNDIDDMDATKLSLGGVENISIVKNNTRLSIERRAFDADEDSIKLNLSTMGRRNYQLEIACSNIDTTQFTVWLQDAANNSSTPIQMSGKTNYDFTIAEGYNPNRFTIVFKQKKYIVLPVSFTSVTAVKQQHDVLIEWNTAQAVNTISYQIERSADGDRFSSLTQLPVQANNQYEWTDKAPLPGVNFYRIKAVDKDGKYSYSNIVYVVMTDIAGGITVYPNPIQNNSIQLLMAGQKTGKYHLTIYNDKGQLLYSESFTHHYTEALKKITPARLLPKGVLTTKISGPANNATLRIVVQ